MRTINQINGRIKKNQTINLYKQLSNNYWGKVGDWRNKEFAFSKGSGESFYTSIKGTFIYGKAKEELRHIRKLPKKDRYYNYSRDNKRAGFVIEGMFGSELHFDIIASIDIEGVILTLHGSNFSPFSGEYKTWEIRSDETWEEFDTEKYFRENILPKYLFPEGTFRTFQIYCNCSKEEALKKWKETYHKKDVFVDRVKAWKNRLKREKNIEIGSGYLTLSEIKNAYNNFKRQAKRKVLFSQPSAVETLERMSFEGDIDSLEYEYSKHISEEFPNNAVFI